MCENRSRHFSRTIRASHQREASRGWLHQISCRMDMCLRCPVGPSAGFLGKLVISCDQISLDFQDNLKFYTHNVPGSCFYRL
jgi:hypothetical protein